MKRLHHSYLRHRIPTIFFAAIVAINVIFLSIFIIMKTYANNEPTDTTKIELRKEGFYPESVTIHIGDTVTFSSKNKTEFWPASNLHPVHTIYPEFDPKAALHPEKSWSFTFTKPGRYMYHDHLSPTYTGTIIVLDSAGNAKRYDPKDLAACEKVPDTEKIPCWDELLTQTIRTKGLDAAFDIFTDLYATDPDIPKACHGWSHILGKEAYEMFNKDREVILRDEVSYCGYGFFHGFIERLLQESNDIKKTKAFCDYASKTMASNSFGVYNNCLHGIGHGSVNIDDPALWGDFQAMIQPGLDNCEKILTTPIDLRTCRDGAFNAMQQYLYRGEYKLKFNDKDIFSICRDQEEKYQESCYFEFIGLISSVTNHDFKKAVTLLMRETTSQETKIASMGKLAADFMQDDIVNQSQEKNVTDCREVRDDLRDVCFGGILNGFMSHGEPKKEYIRGLAFCKSDYLTDQEAKRCFEAFIPAISENKEQTCKTVPKDYQYMCS